MNAAASRQAATIAACLIARNGAQTIERLVTSIRPHVDEICVYLAGESSDSTPRILATLAGDGGAPIRVEQGSWNDDYADARNRADELASSDYICWFDDDEVLEGGAALRTAVELAASEVLYVRRVDVVRADRLSVGFFPRVYRAGLCRWRYAVHEELDPSVLATAQRSIGRPDLMRVIHHPLAAPNRHRHRALVERSFHEGDRRLARQLAWYLAHEDLDDTAAMTVLRGAIKESWAPHELLHLASAYRGLIASQVRLGERDAAHATCRMWLELIQQLRAASWFWDIAWRIDSAFPIPSDDPVWTSYALHPSTGSGFEKPRRRAAAPA